MKNRNYFVLLTESVALCPEDYIHAYPLFGKIQLHFNYSLKLLDLDSGVACVWFGFRAGLETMRVYNFWFNNVTGPARVPFR